MGQQLGHVWCVYEHVLHSFSFVLSPVYHLFYREGHLSVAQLLLDHGAKVNMPSGSENNIPLTLACWKGHKDVVSLLLKNVSNIEHQNKAGCTPLMLAARFVGGVWFWGWDVVSMLVLG